MGTVLLAFAVGLTLPWRPVSDVVDVVVGPATGVLPAALCWAAVRRAGRSRPEILLAALAVTMYALGNAYYLSLSGSNGALPFPSPADVGYLGFAPLMLAAVGVVAARRWRRHVSSVWLDGVVGSLGGASVVAVVLGPVLPAALDRSSLLATAVSVAYPVSDLLLVAAVMGMASLGGRRPAGHWSLMVAGLLLFTATDVVYALEVAAGTYQTGAPLDAGWAVALTLVALWVDGAADDPERDADHEGPATGGQLVVTGLATAAGLGVLLMGNVVPVSTPAVVLAALTLLAAAVRTQMSFRMVSRVAQLRREATTDDLTGLPNRRALYRAGARFAERPTRPRALLLLDLDRFKDVNDSLGHHAGDRLLVQVAERLRRRMRDGDVLARLGGDEFAVVLDGAGRRTAESVADDLAEGLAQPMVVDGMALRSGVSIGIALFPDDGRDLPTLMRKADIAMYKAKASGVSHHIYGGADDVESATRLQTVDELQAAITGGELVLHYQPKVDLVTGDVRSAEALVRWQHPTRGLLYPDAFLRLVERGGLMPALTAAVLTAALDQVAAWQREGCALGVAVNLSASSLIDDGLPDQVAQMLSARGVPPEALQLEITEDLVMANRVRADSILRRLRDLGVRISVDDFGTGYSSLSYLRDLPVDEVKLDRAFVQPMAQDPRATALVASTVALAHGLGLRIVAEGVETPAAYAALARLGCDQAQGYLMCPPVPADELRRWLARRAGEPGPVAPGPRGSTVPAQRTRPDGAPLGVRP